MTCRISTPPGTAHRSGHRARVLIAALSVVALTVAVLQTGVVPVLGVIARQLNASTVDVSWAVTANLLAAAATTPLIGRLADLYSKRRVLLVVLTVVLAGSLLAALTSSLPLLIVARVLQGASFSLYPIGVSILREELAPDRLMRAMAVLSGTLGFGGGMGLVVTGLLMRGEAGYHRVFWLTTAFTVLVIVVVLLVIPAPPAHLGRDGRLGGCARPRHRLVGGAAGDHPGSARGDGCRRARSSAPCSAWSCSASGGGGSGGARSRWCRPRCCRAGRSC